MEAAWPDTVAEKDIPLASIGQHPHGSGRWIAGKNEMGTTVTLGLSDQTPHFLFGGWTGSGKTWAMRAVLWQLAREPENELVLIDCKYGDGLGCLGHLPNLVGPVATNLESARAALAWSVREMRERYETGNRTHRLVVVIDEVQELTGRAGDDAAIEMIRRLVSQGRGARVHVIVGTQNPTMDAFSDPAIRRNLPGRVALRTENAKASEVIVGGSTPRADRLMGAGDAYIVTPSACHRAQLAYVRPEDLEGLGDGEPELAEWPEFDAEAAGTLPVEDAPRWEYGGDELAVALVTVSKSDKAGRGALRAAMDEAGLGRPGSERADRLLGLGREMRTWLVVNDYCLPACQEDAHTVAGYESMEGRVISSRGRQAGRQGVEDE
jgi:hypothetical protein